MGIYQKLKHTQAIEEKTKNLELGYDL